jgi:hypothetical protein
MDVKVDEIKCSYLVTTEKHNIVACLLKARIVKLAETAVASERLCKHGL